MPYLFFYNQMIKNKQTFNLKSDISCFFDVWSFVRFISIIGPIIWNTETMGVIVDEPRCRDVSNKMWEQKMFQWSKDISRMDLNAAQQRGCVMRFIFHLGFGLISCPSTGQKLTAQSKNTFLICLISTHINWTCCNSEELPVFHSFLLFGFFVPAFVHGLKKNFRSLHLNNSPPFHAMNLSF